MIQDAADRGDTKSVLKEKSSWTNKKLRSPWLSKTGEILHSRNKQLGRWV